jgi:hypothetical protein
MKKAIFYNIQLLQPLAIAFALLLQPQVSYSQRNLRYKDVYKVVTEKEKEEAYSLLLVYQKQDPYFANTYLQLGMIAQYWSKDYDALTSLKDVEYFIYNTGLYYGLANAKIDAKEIRKNDKYYLNIDRFKNAEKLNFEEVKAYINELIEANTEYKKNVYIVTNYFNSSIKHYNKCITIFKDINRKNNKIKDIYMTAGPEFTQQLNELESSFDSTIYYLQNYQTAIKNYPIKEYNQKYKLLPIETYRLHGLTGSDFLQDEIPIWDYGTWVKDVKKVINSDISNIRKDINTADDLLNKNTNLLLQTNEFKEDFGLKNIDSRLKFKIGKYDHKSFLLHLFNYKESKVNLLALMKKPINNPYDSLISYSLIQKARYYENIINEKQQCDSLNKNIVKNIDAYDLNKYNDFFTNKYGGEAGLKNYSNNETKLLNKQLESSLDNYKTYVISPNNNQYDSINYKAKEIYLRKTIPDFENAKKGDYYTVDYVKSGRDYYVSGFIVTAKGKAQPFIAKTTRLTDIKWLKILPAKSNACGTNIRVMEQGCELLVTSLDGTKFSNKIYTFDDLGKQKEKADLNLSGYPRYFSFNEINQQYLLIVKGNQANSLNCLEDKLVFAKISSDKKKIIWQTSVNIKGQFVDIISFNQEYYLFSNFTEYSTESVNITSKAGVDPKSTNLLINIINEDGVLVKEKAILNSIAFFAMNVIKLSNKTINVVGLKSSLISPENKAEKQEQEFLYLLLNTDGEVYYDNWK